MDRQIDSNGEQLGNLPQAFTSPALIIDRQLGGASVAWR
jgi:hypothetical protein